MKKLLKSLGLGLLLCAPISNSWADSASVVLEWASVTGAGQGVPGAAYVQCPAGANSMVNTTTVTYTIPASTPDDTVTMLKEYLTREMDLTQANDSTCDNMMVNFGGTYNLSMRGAPGYASIGGDVTLWLDGVSVGEMTFEDTISPGDARCPALVPNATTGAVTGSCTVRGAPSGVQFSATTGMLDGGEVVDDEFYNRYIEILSAYSIAEFRDSFSVTATLTTSAVCTGPTSIGGITNAWASGSVTPPSITWSY